jgi:hypothetical protein
LILLRARAPHLYPGARGVWAAPCPRGRGAEAAPCLIAFADGEAAPGALAPATDGGMILEVGAHVTARGAAIPARRWRLESDGRVWRVRARLPGAPAGGDGFP